MNTDSAIATILLLITILLSQFIVTIASFLNLGRYGGSVPPPPPIWFERQSDDIVTIDGRHYKAMSDDEAVEFIWGGAKDISVTESKIMVYKDGSWKIVQSSSAWEFENDPDWLTSIDIEAISEVVFSVNLKEGVS
jgi:hypothetical protein